MTNLRKLQITNLISMENLASFVVRLLNNWLVNVGKTFTDILQHYVLQMSANKFAVCIFYFRLHCSGSLEWLFCYVADLLN